MGEGEGKEVKERERVRVRESTRPGEERRPSGDEDGEEGWRVRERRRG